ncbi:uncharacterized protein METZ01_LOCUS264852, partial [marine metagenome]
VGSAASMHRKVGFRLPSLNTWREKWPTACAIEGRIVSGHGYQQMDKWHLDMHGCPS